MAYGQEPRTPEFETTEKPVRLVPVGVSREADPSQPTLPSRRCVEECPRGQGEESRSPPWEWRCIEDKKHTGMNHQNAFKRSMTEEGTSC